VRSRQARRSRLGSGVDALDGEPFDLLEVPSGRGDDGEHS
jgi:hypothetical protein